MQNVNWIVGNSSHKKLENKFYERWSSCRNP